LKLLEKKTSDGDCALTFFHLAGTGVLQAFCCGVFQGSPATLSGINPYISIGWAPLEASLLVSMTPGKKEP